MKKLLLPLIMILSTAGAVCADPAADLVAAADKGDLTKVKALIDSGVSADAKDDEGNTPLMSAASNGNIAMVEYLLGKAANVNLTDAKNRNALMWAISGNSQNVLPIAKLLLDKGIAVDHQNIDGRTALILAVVYGKKDLVELLLERNASPWIQHKYGNKTALMEAQENNFPDIAELLGKRMHIKAK